MTNDEFTFEVEGFKTYEDGLRFFVRRMRERASKAGPMHSWWDVIFDIEAFLAGKPTLLQKSAREWVEYAAELTGTPVEWGDMPGDWPEIIENS